MRADMVEHADEVRLKRHRIARHAKVLRFRGLVRQMLKIHGPLEKLVRGHVVFDQERKVDNAGHRCCLLGDTLPFPREAARIGRLLFGFFFCRPVGRQGSTHFLRGKRLAKSSAISFIVTNLTPGCAIMWW
jgi:hypothetical protein